MLNSVVSHLVLRHHVKNVIRLTWGMMLLIRIGLSETVAQENTPSDSLLYQNVNRTIDDRVNDLVGRMTLDEKVKQLLYDAPAIERLGIPAYNWWNEGLHGVARNGRATVFPQAIGLAATWDPELLHNVATAISDEARAKYHDALRKGRHGIYEGLTFWSPNINIFRDPRWGRGMETYGEDPYLAGRLAVAFVKGMQGDNPRYLKTVATPKHFAVHSGPESERHVFDSVVDERDLRDTYLPQFRAAVVEGGAQSVMCAYNRFRGTPCCGSNELLQKILRDEWGFDGYVVSDCWAIMDFYTTHMVVKSAPEAAAMALRAGVDLNCGVTFDSLGIAVRNGLVNEDLVDRSVKRLFRARFQLGMFDPVGTVPYAATSMSVVESREHLSLALEAARKSVVLLKNENHILPLRKDLRSIAVIGPNANEVELLLGNYNGVPSTAVTPLEGIRRAVSPLTKIIYARGCDLAEHMPTLVSVPSACLSGGIEDGKTRGLRGEYFGNNMLDGEPKVSRIDTAVDFTWWDLPAVKGVPDSFSVRWSGAISPPVSGTYALGMSSLGSARLYLDDSLFLEVSDRHVVLTRSKNVALKADEVRKIRIEYCHSRPDAIVRLVWSVPNQSLMQEALNAAQGADAVVLCMGLSPRLEGEEMDVDVPGFSGGDRVNIDLPWPQEELIREIAKLGKPTILVLLSGSAVGIPWEAEHLPAILEAWYPGQTAGTALADILFGDHNPSGRLPVTFYKSIDQLPPFTDYAMKGRTYRYFTGEPLYPFGYGLSYTTFRYSNLRLPESSLTPADSVAVSVDIQNTGDRDGEEVVELYLSHVNAAMPVPIRSLEGLKRVFLKSGEKATLSFTLEPRQLSVIDDQNHRTVMPGALKISVGGGQPLDTGSVIGRAVSESVSGRLELMGVPNVIQEK